MRKRKGICKRSIVMVALIIFGTLVLISGSVMAMENPADESRQEPITQETVIHQDAVSFTPDGNLTLVDDFTRSDESEKQFIIVKTRDDSIFYIVIDRTSRQENVYFLNLVDDQDLIALLNNESMTKEIESLTKLPEPASSEQPAPASEAPDVSDSSPLTVQYGLIIIFVAVIGGVGFWLIRFKPFGKQRKKEVVIPEYLFEDSEIDSDDLASAVSGKDETSTDDNESTEDEL